MTIVKYRNANSRTRRSLITSPSEWRSRCSSSRSRRSTSHSCSSGSSQPASRGPSGSFQNTSTPAMIAGIASSANSHCQSLRPATPSIALMIPPEIGAPTA